MHAISSTLLNKCNCICVHNYVHIVENSKGRIKEPRKGFFMQPECCSLGLFLWILQQPNQCHRCWFRMSFQCAHFPTRDVRMRQYHPNGCPPFSRPGLIWLGVVVCALQQTHLGCLQPWAKLRTRTILLPQPEAHFLSGWPNEKSKVQKLRK